MRKNSEVSFFLLTNAKKRNELFGKYRSFDIATLVASFPHKTSITTGSGVQYNIIKGTAQYRQEDRRILDSRTVGYWTGREYFI
jgi:hypothetical protein